MISQNTLSGTSPGYNQETKSASVRTEACDSVNESETRKESGTAE
jgi:hypothetical protein